VASPEPAAAADEGATPASVDEPWSGWRLRWPGGADRVEILNGCLSFELRGFSSKLEWTDDDVAAAKLVYPEQQVSLSPGRTYLWVHPPKPSPAGLPA
jgi:hypothetical protein